MTQAFDESLMYRAYSTLEIKQSQDSDGVVEGIASTPSIDEQGDIMEPGGADFKLPLPLLWQHDSKQPIGHVIAARAAKDGIHIRAKILRINDPGRLKDRLDEAWQSVKHGLVRGLSIGFKGVEAQPIKASSGGVSGIHFLKWRWLELSCVTMPANSDATILAIKSADAPFLSKAGPVGLSKWDQIAIEAELSKRGIKGLPVVKIKG